MFVPLHDNTPLSVIRFQFVTGLVLALNVVVFLYSHVLLGEDGEMAVAISFGMVPAVLTDYAVLDPSMQLVPEPATVFTYMFVHAGWMHIISNMLFLWVFADNVEDSFGHVGFLVFYLVCGALAGLAHMLMQPASESPLVGASGAVSGVMAAYLVLYPRARLWVLLFMKLPLRISATWALIGWFGFQILSLFGTEQPDVSIAWWAHIGGFLAGLAITFAFRGRLRARAA